MKTSLSLMFILPALIVGVQRVPAQSPVIASFSQNGVLVCSNLGSGSVVTVTWASSLSGPWQTNWAGLSDIPVTSNGTVQVSVPMFYRVLVRTNSGSANMVLIPAGSFTMGDLLDGFADAIPTDATLSAYYMDANEVSFGQWQTVFSYATSRGYSFTYTGLGKALDHPVHSVIWFDCVKWCNARSEQEGLTPVYYADAAMTQVYTNGQITPFVDWTANGYRLPTEAEWEKAARGGLSGQRYPWGNTISPDQANYFGNTNYATGDEPYTSPVGSFPPNGYGIYDIAGNVFEWCWDWYGIPYAGGNDPRGPATGSEPVLRGGSCYDPPLRTACALRFSLNPSWYYNWIGFRCVRRQ